MHTINICKYKSSVYTIIETGMPTQVGTKGVTLCFFPKNIHDFYRKSHDPGSINLRKFVKGICQNIHNLLHMNFPPQDEILFPTQGDWYKGVNDEYVFQLWKGMHLTFPDFIMLDYPRPEVLHRAFKKINKKFGKGLFSEEFCKLQYALLFDRFRCFGLLLSRNCIEWNAQTNIVTITNMKMFESLCEVLYFEILSMSRIFIS